MPRGGYEYSNRELADIHFVYGFCNGNARAAVREYARRYPTRRTPNFLTFINVHSRIEEHGIRLGPVERAPVLRRPRNDEEEEVLLAITRDPRLSVRRLGIRLGLPKTRVWEILKRNGLHPYHFRKVQNVLDPDYRLRSVFCAWIHRKIPEDPHFTKKIMWTDEAKFTRTGITNFRNLHVCAEENPHAKRPASFQHEFSVNVSAAMIDDQLIGPIELPPNLNGENFLNFLRNDFSEALMDLPLIYRRRMWLQMDGAPAHFARNVRQHLNETFPGRWVGREGPVSWPPRSPDDI